jgi:branched-chain amino acid transport system substrate-binding protein
MQRRGLLLFAATVLATSFGLATAGAQDIKVGVVGPKTGPLAGGAEITHFPNFRLWAKLVNDRGGLKLKTGQRKIQLIEYDDRTQPPETIKAVERLATVDKADLIMPVYGTGFNLAVAPIFAKYGYPLLAQAFVTDQGPALIKRYPNLFIVQGTTQAFATDVVNVLKKMREEGKIGNKVAVVNVADAFGIELANAGRPIFEKAGFQIVYDKSYPLGTQDLSPVVKAAKAANPDAFVAWSYPPDTFALLEQAKIEGLNPKVYYSAVATAFQGFYGKYGQLAENVLGAGGYEDTPEIRAYMKIHKEVTGVDADYWGSAVYGSLLQVLEQSIEGVGSLDKKAITAYIKSHTFKTVVGEMDLRNQQMTKYWTVGQWQDGFFQAVTGVGYDNYKPIKLKTNWQ